VGILAERVANEFKLELLSTSSVKTEFEMENVPAYLERDNKRFGTQPNLAIQDDHKNELMVDSRRSFFLSSMQTPVHFFRLMLILAPLSSA
jgi:hypothetical protein